MEETLHQKGGDRYGVPVKREMRTCWSVCEGVRESFESTSSYNRGKVVTGVSKVRPLVPRITRPRERSLHRHVNGIPNGPAFFQPRGGNYIRRNVTG